jgi:putative transposase
VDEAALFAAREANLALVATAAKETRRQRRESVKRQRHQAEVQLVTVANDAVPSDPSPLETVEEPSLFKVEIEPW